MEKKQRRQELRFLQRHAVWLQKVVFGLKKVEATREKVFEAREEDPSGFTLHVNGADVSVAELEASLERRVVEVRERMRELEA